MQGGQVWEPAQGCHRRGQGRHEHMRIGALTGADRGVGQHDGRRLRSGSQLHGIAAGLAWMPA